MKHKELKQEELNQKESKQKELFLKGYPIPLLICPDCKMHIPNIRMIYAYEKMGVYLKCSCSKEEKVKQIKLFLNEIKGPRDERPHPTKSIKKGERISIDYLKLSAKENIIQMNSDEAYTDVNANANVNLKAIQNAKANELIIKCSKHNKVFNSYCKGCLTNLCDDCQLDHQSHKVIQITQKDKMDLNLDRIDSFIKKNKDYAKKLIDRIDKIIKIYETIKKDIKYFHLRNESINDYMKQVYLSLCRTTVAFKNSPSYELMTMQNNMTINELEYKDENLDITKEYLNLTAYYLINFLVLQKTNNDAQLTLMDHTDTVYCVARLIDGRFASGSADKTICLWNSTTFKSEAVLVGHTKNILGLAPMKDGRLASCSDDMDVRVWNTKTNVCEFVLALHLGWVRSVIQLSDSHLVSGSGDKTICIWNIATKGLKTELLGHKDSIESLCELSDNRLASGSDDLSIRIWCTLTYKCLNTLIGHTKAIFSLVELDNKQLVSGSEDKTIRLWNMTTYECVHVIENAHTSVVYCMIKLSDGRLVSGSSDKLIKIWNMDTMECKESLSGHTGSIYGLAQLNNGTLISCSFDMNIKVWTI